MRIDTILFQKKKESEGCWVWCNKACTKGRQRFSSFSWTLNPLPLSIVFNFSVAEGSGTESRAFFNFGGFDWLQIKFKIESGNYKKKSAPATKYLSKYQCVHEWYCCSPNRRSSWWKPFLLDGAQSVETRQGNVFSRGISAYSCTHGLSAFIVATASVSNSDIKLTRSSWWISYCRSFETFPLMYWR